MIIGISGKIGSGKDTVGRIIQYLTWCENTNSSDLPDFQLWSDSVPNPCPIGHHQKWETKKFAGKLKEICSMITGIPVADFEKQSVKDSFLPDEWIKYGIDGDHDFTPDDYGYVSSYEEAVELANNVGENPKFIQKYKMTVRDLLQQVGTNALRKVIHPNIWINALFSDYKISNPREGVTYSQADMPKWIITDTRFENEAESIKDQGGILIRVVRDITVHCPHCQGGGCPTCGGFGIMNPPSTHPSETGLDHYKFEHVIENNGTIDELVEKVQSILTKEKL